MRCLGIESSCDETALALVVDGRLEDSVLASQTELHALFGGVVPELASREHYRFIGPLFDRLLQRNQLDAGDLDAIAVARGPGLLGSILVGVAFAKGLALALGRTFIGVNHLHAHLLATGMENEQIYPALGLLVSGGHTQLYHISSPWEFVQLGRTLDDAAGEAFDKTGSFIGMSYPAGKQIDLLAAGGSAQEQLLPRPYLDNNNLDFSFSGLKTAAINYLGQNSMSPASQELKNFCASFNLAVAETLCAKTERAIKKNPDIKSLWMAGGVAANSLAREKMASLACRYELPFLTPSAKLCTDNGAMIAYAGYLLVREGFFHTLDMEAVPRGRVIPEDMQRTGA